MCNRACLAEQSMLGSHSSFLISVNGPLRCKNVSLAFTGEEASMSLHVRRNAMFCSVLNVVLHTDNF